MILQEYNQLSFAVEIVDTLLQNAITLGASDIHLESFESALRVRFRIDGILIDQASIALDLMSQVISRIKVLSNIDIAQKRLPQDGKFNFLFNNNNIDLRVSTFPSVYGEKVVIRILDRLKTKIDLDNLGFQEEILQKFRSLLNKSHGFILVTGPTGSGKTTTLYASLSEIISPEKNVITLEDPVEYHIDGITQGQINNTVGFTFAKGIRSLLRQDPDIAMIGEIRDKESAKIAIEAALTGHLVFSTVHTNDACGAIMRLMDMQIEPFLINAAVTGVLAQRLARKLCEHCKFEYIANDNEKQLLNSLGFNVKKLFNAKGCSNCHNGFKGRTGIFELLIPTDQLSSLIIQQPKFEQIKSQAIKDGLQTLLQDAEVKLEQGITSLNEIVRVII